MIPILMDHDINKPIGVLREENGALFIEFTQDVKITMEQVFEIFGGVGLRIIGMRDDGKGVLTIKKAQILEFSLGTHSRWATCAPHNWVTNGGKGGEPLFRPNAQMGAAPIMHVRCSVCGDRTWMTPDQWDKVNKHARGTT